MSLQSICTDLRLLLALALALWAAPGIGQVSEIERALMPGAVIQGHAKYEQECEKCHKRFDKNAQTELCADCHKDVAADMRGKRGLHGHQEDVTCKRCHPDHQGRDAKVAVVDKEKFDHDRTDFRLRGAHRQTKNKCADCHANNKKYREAPSDCFTCHRKDDSHKGGLGKKCEECHGDVKWKETQFDHDKKTKFKLQGEHAATECKECHIDGKYKDTPKDCYSCHKRDDLAEGHRGHFGSKCEKCHTADAWDEPTFNHDRDTKYRLKGKHARTECGGCHKNALYTEKLQTKCLACHRKDDDDKGHKGSLGDKCDKCHSEQEWKTTSFDHDRDTKYRLEGKHKQAKCEGCHKSGLKPLPGTKSLEKTPTRCIECHRKQDDDKGHKGKFGEKCETCHKSTEWKKSHFDHDLDTKYLLRGKHRETKCASCHTGILYTDKLTSDCYSCHRKQDDEKGHKGQLGKRCDNCHTEKDWKVEKFDHNRSRFPLTGLHGTVECKKCHKTAAFREAPRECVGCHDKDDLDKGHKGRFGTLCENCHNTRTWKSWDFDHDKTRFRLEGKHEKAECYACHKTAIKGRALIPRACASCHVKDDVHDGGFGNQCEVCHVASSWKKVKR